MSRDMSEPSALTMKPPDGVHHGMCLQFHSSAVDAIAFAESSSSSSASPDSMRSLSSMSGGRTDSPLDVEMPDGIMGRKVATGEDDSGIQSPDCRVENDNDNSVSVYLDADEVGWCEIRDDQDNVTLVLTQKQGQRDDHSDGQCNNEHGRRSSDDSSATEAVLCCSGYEDDDDNDDDEEDSFLSLSSADVVMRCPRKEDQILSSSGGPVSELHEQDLRESVAQDQMQNSSRSPLEDTVSEFYQEDLQESMELHTDEGQMHRVSRRPSVEPVGELHQVALQEDQMQSLPTGSDVGFASELHQETLHETMEVDTEEQVHRPTRRSDMGHVSELSQEALQESMEIYSEECHMHSSTRMPEVGHDNELSEEAPQESMELHTKDCQMQNSTRRHSLDPVNELQEEVLQESMQLHTEEGQMQGSSGRPKEDPVNELHQEVLQESTQLHTEEVQMQSSSERPDVGSVSEFNQEVPQDFVGPHIEISLEVTISETALPVSEEVLVVSEPSAPTQDPTETPAFSITLTESPCFTNKNNKAKLTLKNTKDRPGQGLTKPTTKPSMTKSSKMEIKRFPRPDLKNIKPKVISRAASVPRPAHSSQSAAGTEKKLPPARGRAANSKDQDVDGVIKKRRSSSNQARVTLPAPVSDPKPKGIHLQTEDEPQCVSDANASSEITVNSNQGQNQGAEIMEVVKEEAECYKEEVPPDTAETPEEIPKDMEQSGSKLKTPKAVGGTASVATGVRAAVPAGVSKTCSPASSCKAPQKPASSRLPIKNLTASLSSSSLGSAVSENNTPAIGRGVAQVVKSEEKIIRPSSSSQGKPASNKPTVGIRNRANSTPVKPTTAGQKAPALPNNVAAKPTQNALQRSGSARPSRPPGTTVEKSSRGVRSVPGRAHGGAGGGGGGVTHGEDEEEKHLRLQNERKSQSILQLRKLVAHGNRRLEALALVIQHIFTEREEALKQKKDVSLQLKNLREELTHSVSCCERLQKEKEEVCVALEAAVLKLQQQHQAELTQLEETLRDFYSAEWDKTHQAYQEEADKYRALMQQQVEEMRNKQEVLRKEQEVAHAQDMVALKQGYEASLTELRKAHKNNMQELDNTRKQSEALMNEKIESLMEENKALSARLREEEERRKAFEDKSQKDPHMVYLEQELESLKVVLEIKTSQLHQQDKKLMQMDKLMESNVKLEECLKKLQQENEDYKARMDKHAALSRQLSSEQAMLQQTLQMESKVNKRLSMENEELLWKLHNGDLSSPRRLSPTSPFHSPRNSASFPSAPISPR